MKRVIPALILAIASLAVTIGKQEFTVSTHHFASVIQPAMFRLMANSNNRELYTIITLPLSFRYFRDNPDRVLTKVNCDADDWRFLRDAEVHLFSVGNAGDLGHFEKRGVLAKRFQIKVGTFEGGPNEKATTRAFSPCGLLKNLRRPTPERPSTPWHLPARGEQPITAATSSPIPEAFGIGYAPNYSPSTAEDPPARPRLERNYRFIRSQIKFLAS